MTRLLTAILVATALAPVPAHAAPPEPLLSGGCEYSAPLQKQWPYDDGRHYAVLWSDPVVVGAGNAVVTCTVQLGPDGTHAGPDAIVRSSPETTGVVALPPTTVTFDVDPWFSYCTQVTYADGRTFYLDAGTGEWSTDPSVRCYWVVFGPPPMELPGIVPYVANEFLGPYADPYLCPVLAGAPVLREYDAPVWIAPDGDLWLGGLRTWDC